MFNMTIRFINVGLIEKKKSKCTKKELNQVVLEPETAMFFADYVSSFLTSENEIHMDDLYLLTLQGESNFSPIQVEAMKKVILEHFDCLKLKENSSKSTVLSAVKKIVQSFLIIDEMLPYTTETESINQHEELNPIMLSVWKFISHIETQYQIIIEECFFDDIETKLVRHYFCNGTLQSIQASISFPNAPFQYNGWNEQN